jgi:hypothetical protein
VAPVVRTRSCQERHLGHAISGSILVTMDDRTKLIIAAGDGDEIPPGHEVEMLSPGPGDRRQSASTAVACIRGGQSAISKMPSISMAIP